MTAPHILIVDDDTALLEALTEALKIRVDDVQVDTAESASAALARIQETDYDAIVSDIKMPGIDGLALLERIRAVRPATPTLLITGHGEHDLAIQAVRGGAYDYIQKPVDRDYFIASLKRAIQVRQLSRQVEEQRVALERYASELEHMVEERTRELVEANRVKEEFLSLASHELRNPLVTLTLHMQLTGMTLERAGVPLPPHWERMRQAIARMEVLVNDLIDAVRIASGKLALSPERCDVRMLCAQVATEQEASTGRVVTLNMPAEALEIIVDVDRMSQVLTNLLANAIQYSLADRPVVLSAARVAGEVLMSVADQGAGIPHEHLPHIFERFYQVPGTSVQTGPRVGLGLGLYICREIVERHGGRIWAESTVGQGSRFYVALRMAPAAGGRRRSPKAQDVREPSPHR